MSEGDGEHEPASRRDTPPGTTDYIGVPWSSFRTVLRFVEDDPALDHPPDDSTVPGAVEALREASDSPVWVRAARDARDDDAHTGQLDAIEHSREEVAAAVNTARRCGLSQQQTADVLREYANRVAQADPDEWQDVDARTRDLLRTDD